MGEAGQASQELGSVWGRRCASVARKLLGEGRSRVWGLGLEHLRRGP